MRQAHTLDTIIGVLLCLVSAGAILAAWRIDADLVRLGTGVLVVVAVAALSLRASAGRLVFVAIAMALTVLDAFAQPDWFDVIFKGLGTAAFIAAFFSTLSTLGYVARTAPSIRECGLYLAQQPPGRRYAALTVGGQLFSLLLGYGSVPLLGNLALASTSEEPDPRVKAVRTRRMLLAIHRAMMSIVPWSPLSLGITLTLVLIPQASWSEVVLPCFVSGTILATTGWALDSLIRPRIAATPHAAPKPEGSWRSLLPLLILLCVLAIAVGGLFELTGVAVPGLVMVVVPLVAAVWVVWQARQRNALRHLGQRVRAYVGESLPAQSSEILLLMMAGYIGALGGALIEPVTAGGGVDVSAVPAFVILAAPVWLIPLAGQIGMNPVLATSLLVPLLPPAAEIGLAPPAVIVSITAGWALSGICSPFTATTILVGGLAGVSPRTVGLRWNGIYSLISAIFLTVWVLVFGYLFAVR